MSIRVMVPGKLILLGEYAVLEGADALVASVNKYVVAEISAGREKICQISSNLDSDSLKFTIDKDGSCLLIRNQSKHLIKKLNFMLTIINKICRNILESGFAISSFNLNIDSSQFYVRESKLGIGSSAALAVALIVSITKYLGIDEQLFEQKIDLFRFALETHYHAQGNSGSGIDVAASVCGGINIYSIKSPDILNFSQQITPVPVLQNLYLLTIWSGISVSTQQLLARIHDYRLQNSVQYEEVMSRLSTLSNAGCAIYQQKKVTEFLEIVHDYYEVLKDLSTKSRIQIISDIHKKIAEIVYHSGGVYKPSGAGGGDIGIALSGSITTIENIKSELARNKINQLSMEISTHGVVAVRS